MLFLDFCATVSAPERLLDYLRNMGVLHRTVICGKCTREMAIQCFSTSCDGCRFRCSRCKATKSIRTGSFMAECRLSLQKFSSIVYLLQAEVPFKFIAELLDIHPNTVTDYANLIRENYGRDLVENGALLGGQGKIVQVDESLLAKSKRSRNNSARPIREQWVFGAFDPQQGQGWIQLIDRRDAETLEPIIQSCIPPETTIYSDAWGAYGGLRKLGYDHHVVVHEHHFVDPETGVHTNNVEAFWQRCKRRFKRMYGTSRGLLASHVDEFLWLERHGKTFFDRVINTFKLLKRHYTE